MFGSTPRLGKVQLTMMQVLWDRGSATAREITEVLSASEPIAHSTVQTLLRKLEVKGAVTHSVEDRTFVFRPLYDRAQVSDGALRDVLARVFHGSVYGLVSQLLAYERLSPEEITRLRSLIDQNETGGADHANVE